jgi:hypothetical protein
MKRTWLLAPVLAAFSMVGCAGPVYYANVPPPPVRAEAIIASPGPGFVWVGGYWGWRGNAHVWVAGSWMRPPHPHSVWVAPRWEARGGRYYFHEGRWR